VTEHAAALTEVETIVERGGDADDVLRDVLDALHRHGVSYAAIRFVEQGALVEGPTVGEAAASLSVPVTYRGEKVGELEVAEDRPFAERVADHIAPFVLVGWDTRGEPWV
jgi:hypothetical protein